jgi:coniferyl-aldehyde dehydrogenase
LITGVTDEMKVMQDEIFGPLLPLIEVQDVDAAIAYVNARPRPLALYHFDDNRARTEAVLTRTVSGGVTINDTLYHIAQENLPFGGVGPSGLGRYHARDGFLAFSHPKAVLRQARWPTTALMRPPYRDLANRLVAFLTR